MLIKWRHKGLTTLLNLSVSLAVEFIFLILGVLVQGRHVCFPPELGD